MNSFDRLSPLSSSVLASLINAGACACQRDIEASDIEELNGGAAILMQMRLVFIANFYGPSSRFKWGVRGAYPLCIWPTASDI